MITKTAVYALLGILFAANGWALCAADIAPVSAPVVAAAGTPQTAPVASGGTGSAAALESCATTVTCGTLVSGKACSGGTFIASVSNYVGDPIDFCESYPNATCCGRTNPHLFIDETYVYSGNTYLVNDAHYEYGTLCTSN